MGFWVGFADAMNKHQDRRERQKMLMQELGAKREGMMLKLFAAPGTRKGVAKDESAALSALRKRAMMGNPEGEGVDNFINSLRRAGKGSEVLKTYIGMEAAAAKKQVELYVTGRDLIDNTHVYNDPASGKLTASVSYEEIFGTDFSQMTSKDFGQFYGKVASNIGSSNNSVVDINPAVAFGTSVESRSKIQDVFMDRLLGRFDPKSTAHGTKVNSGIVNDMQILSGNNKALKGPARARLLQTQEAVELYHEMSTGSLGDRDITNLKEFSFLGDVGKILTNWDTTPEEEQESYLDKYGFIRQIVRPDVGSLEVPKR